MRTGSAALHRRKDLAKHGGSAIRSARPLIGRSSMWAARLGTTFKGRVRESGQRARVQLCVYGCVF